MVVPFIGLGNLQTFCLQLYQLSESIQSTVTPGSSRPHAKRTKLENPISALLHSIHTQPSSNARCYHLQTLLFFVERYWSLIHHSFKEEVINALLQHVTSDDGVVQSWVFLNFAAIAYAEGFATARKPSPNKIDSPMLTSTVWDPIWTHAIRRANVPTVCRSACHTGHTFLVALYNQTDLSRILLTSHHVLLEIETLAKDMDVQGPAYPYDSVCMFLSQCLSIASQDVRLYRMQLEDKVLSWLIDSWKMSGTERTKVSLHGVRDIFVLLETVCGLSKRVDLPVYLSLPTCQIVDSVIEEYEGKVIRDFLLYAKLPSFQQNPNVGRSASTNNQAASVTDLQLLAPRGRERRISAFFLKSLESLISEWEVLRDNVTAEMSRRTLDLAVTAITFETLLMFNGTTSNRQVLHKAAKVISMVTPLLNENRWTVAEKSLVLSALESIVHHPGYSHSKKTWETLSWPGTKSGIKEKILSSLTPNEISCRGAYSTQRISFLRLIWQNAEVNKSLHILFILRTDPPIFRFKRRLNPLLPFCGRCFAGFLWTHPAVRIRQQMLTIKIDLGLFGLHQLMALLERHRRWRMVNLLDSYSKYVSLLLPVALSYSLALESQPVIKSLQKLFSDAQRTSLQDFVLYAQSSSIKFAMAL